MDESFLHFNEMLVKLCSLEGFVSNEDDSIVSEIQSFIIETPVEMSIQRNTNQLLQLGTVPPLYPVETTFAPVFHNIRFTAVKSE